ADVSLPTPELNTGGSVVILSPIDPAPLVAWLNARGIAAWPLPAPATAADAARAVQQLRSRAAELRLSPTRVALLGFGLGANVAAEAAYLPGTEAAAASRPDFVALIAPTSVPVFTSEVRAPPTFLVGSSQAEDKTPAVELWQKLRAARVPVDAHFFARADQANGLAGGNPAAGTWPALFHAWARFSGLLTDAPRLPVKGTVYLDGRTLPHGYVIFTPVNFVGVGPIVGRVLNSTAGVPMGEFSITAPQGPVAGRYKVDVRQNMNRWLSNSFSGDLVGGRGGPTPEKAHFGHHRVLAPSITDQRSFTKVRPGDAQDYIVEFRPGSESNLALRIEVFSADDRNAPAPETMPEADGGILGGPKNPGQAAYVDQIRRAPRGPVPGIPDPILLWPKGAPGAVPDANGVLTDEDKPALYAFPASGASSTRAAFLVVPGGAFTNRGMDNEGVQIARFLNRHGIGGFVLRYRIGPNYPSRTISTADGQRAMRLIRTEAATFGVDPNRLGVIGFSAGAELIGDAFYNSVGEADPAAADPIERVSARANFSALIYGGRNLQKPSDAPPTFLFNTVEDIGHLGVQVSVLNSLRGAGVPVEAHFYQVGPHGTSMSPGDPQLGQWPDLMVHWLESRLSR
ncbi:MAG TPA: alpha/beta hydrolase, partial [Opitutaceae bacterium]|nr:alpha/beta hydrolase [Opitutaceae bacterium]